MPSTGRGLFFLVKEFNSKNKYKETQTQKLQINIKFISIKSRSKRLSIKRRKNCVEQKRQLL